MIPKLRFPEFNDSWNKIEVDSLGEIKGGGTPSKQIESYWNGTIDWISSSDLMEESIWEINTHRFISKEALMNSATKLIPEGSILIVTRVGLGKVALSDKPICTSQDFSNLILKPNYSKPFVAYVVKNLMLKLSLVNQGTSIKGVTTETLKSAEVTIPSFSEQQRIEQVLKSVDQKINLLTKKKEALETYKKGLMQKIFSQEIRFKREDGTDYPEWNEVFYSEFLKERDDKQPQSDEFPLCSFVAHKGVVPKGDRYNREFLVSDKKGKKYKRTKKGDFIYSSNNLETGSIGLNEYGNGCISPVYSVFSIDKGCDINFIAHYLVTKANLHKMIRFRQGVMYGQWRIHETDFLKIKVAIPSNEEQKHIGEVLKSMNSGLEELERLVSATSKLKNGLLQQMFV